MSHEYFLTQFASAEGKNGGQFYTPSCAVRTIVEMLSPYRWRIYDPACGSGGMFVQSEKFVESHGGKFGDISIYGQESNHTTRRLAVMNLAIRGIEGIWMSISPIASQSTRENAAESPASAAFGSRFPMFWSISRPE
jgi:type I restriction-modification system DNA methylase subunit